MRRAVQIFADGIGIRRYGDNDGGGGVAALMEIHD